MYGGNGVWMTAQISWLLAISSHGIEPWSYSPALSELSDYVNTEPRASCQKRQQHVSRCPLSGIFRNGVWYGNKRGNFTWLACYYRRWECFPMPLWKPWKETANAACSLFPLDLNRWEFYSRKCFCRQTLIPLVVIGLIIFALLGEIATLTFIALSDFFLHRTIAHRPIVLSISGWGSVKSLSWEIVNIANI